MEKEKINQFIMVNGKYFPEMMIEYHTCLDYSSHCSFHLNHTISNKERLSFKDKCLFR
mgnify:FL=1